MSTPGKLIRLANVKTGAPAGAERVDIAPGDSAALKIGALTHAISARRMTNKPEGGVNARCGFTGAVLENVGANANRLQVVERLGFKGLYSGPAASGGQGAVAALRLPAGSLTSSFTMALVVYFDPLDHAGNYLTNFAAGWTGAAVTRGLPRGYGLQYNTPIEEAKGGVGIGAGTTLRIFTALPPSKWSVILYDYNHETRVLTLSVNGSTPITFTEPAGVAPMTPESFLELGYSVSNNGLRNSCIAECYTFNQSLMSQPRTTTQAQEMIAAIKTQYGIT